MAILFGSGSIYHNTDIILETDPSSLVSFAHTGSGNRQMFDRRVNAFRDYDVFLFTAKYADDVSIEVRVNTEFGTAQIAGLEALDYAQAIGRIPAVLRSEAKTVSIHKGDELWGGGSGDFLIHTGSADAYKELKIVEEVLVHEAAHISLETQLNALPAWAMAQQADPDVVSDYASQFPDREDIAETFLFYLALRGYPNRLSAEDTQDFLIGVSNRIGVSDVSAV